jgi:hypothetical protein
MLSAVATVMDTDWKRLWPDFSTCQPNWRILPSSFMIKCKYVTRKDDIHDVSNKSETDDRCKHLPCFRIRPMLRSQRLAGVQVNNSFHVPKDEVLCSLHTVAFPATMSPCPPSLLQVHCEQRVLPTLKCYVNKDSDGPQWLSGVGSSITTKARSRRQSDGLSLNSKHSDPKQIRSIPISSHPTTNPNYQHDRSNHVDSVVRVRHLHGGPVPTGAHRAHYCW